MKIKKVLDLPESLPGEEDALGGWACAGLGIGLVVLLGCLLVAVKTL